MGAYNWPVGGMVLEAAFWSSGRPTGVVTIELQIKL